MNNYLPPDLLGAAIATGLAAIREKERRQAEALARYRRPVGECAFCDKHRDNNMMPSHTPSDRCESGKHPHCTCDTCF